MLLELARASAIARATAQSAGVWPRAAAPISSCACSWPTSSTAIRYATTCMGPSCGMPGARHRDRLPADGRVAAHVPPFQQATPSAAATNARSGTDPPPARCARLAGQPLRAVPVHDGGAARAAAAQLDVDMALLGPRDGGRAAPRPWPWHRRRASVDVRARVQSRVRRKWRHRSGRVHRRPAARLRKRSKSKRGARWPPQSTRSNCASRRRRCAASIEADIELRRH